MTESELSLSLARRQELAGRVGDLTFDLGESQAREQRLQEIIDGYEREVIGWARKVGCVAGTPPRELVPETAQRMSEEIARLRVELACYVGGSPREAEVEMIEANNEFDPDGSRRAAIREALSVPDGEGPHAR